MNVELVNKLIEQATAVSEGGDPDYRYEHFDKALFAELIIKDALDVALYGDEFEQARSNVKQYFGVKE